MKFEFSFWLLVAYAATVALANETFLPWQQEFLDLTNDARKKAGIKPISMNSKVNEAAHQHALNMKKNNEFSHTAGGSMLGDRLLQQGVDYEKCGETLADGDNAKEAFSSMMRSEKHKQTVVSVKFKADPKLYFIL